jgi:hypothetical protein
VLAQAASRSTFTPRDCLYINLLDTTYNYMYLR